MEVTSHLLSGVSLGSVSEVSEVDLAAQLVEQTPDHSLTLPDKGFYALGLLHYRQSAGTERHWMLPLRKGAQYQVVRTLGAGQELVELRLSALYLRSQLSIMPWVAPGKRPRIMEEILGMAAYFVLPEQRERHYPVR